ncbi:MAG: Dam family site-specific DNA-(adenine-N6)-methyltransferase [Candidatus Adiutrix sp.]
MNGKTPHIVQYQGSKRILAPQIMQYMPKHFNRLLEPFAGMAAISVAVSQTRRTAQYCINDLNAPLVNMLKTAVEEPHTLVERYTSLWNKQFDYGDEHVKHFYDVRTQFNAGDESPENMLYLLARCVKGAVRYGKKGKFNQSPDKRRHGTNPRNIEANVYAVSSLLKGKSRFSALDYREIFKMAQPGDLVYMDPPYQGVSNTRDNRYFSGLPFAEFAEALELLNKKNVDFLISYDGECGGKEYGEELPTALECKKMLLNAGTSSQATLLGRKEITFEALYVSRNLQPYEVFIPQQMTLMDAMV